MLTTKFQSFVKEQHFLPVFCRKADPESKGKVENVVKYVKGNFLSGRLFYNIDRLNEEARLWLERTGNGKEHGTTRLIPNREFIVEKNFMMPYYGTPQPPQEYMTEYHVRKDNTVQYRGNYYSVPSGTTGVEKQQYGYKKLKAVWNCTVKIRENFWAGILLTWEEGRSYMMKTSEARNAGTQKLAERILIYVSYNKEVAYGWKICAGERNATTGVTWK